MTHQNPAQPPEVTERMTLNRRHFLTMLGLGGTFAAMSLGNPVEAAHYAAGLPAKLSTPQASGVSSDDALARLLDGNKRFVAGRSTYPHLDDARKAEAAKGQAPFASIISCSDSRVPPELIFDAGLGDLFVARTAGNIADDVVIGSIEYSIAVLGSSLLVVMGHERCGAVVAAVEGKPLPGKIGVLAEAIKPAVDKVRAGGGDIVDASVRENVRMTVARLSAMGPILADYVTAGKLKIVGMRYDLDDVKVEVIA